MIWKKKLKMKFQTIYETVLSYCLKCRKNTEIKNSKVAKIKNGRIVILTKRAIFDSIK